MTNLQRVLIVFLMCSTSVIYGQLGFCGGSTGDAIFTESFGNGTNFGPPLAPGITTYPFVTTAPQDGFYTLYFNTGLYSSWHNSPDRSPDVTDGINGKALIVNANNNVSGEFYKRTVSGLCVNTTFEFSAWVMNVYNPLSNICTNNQIPINVRFEIWNDTQTVLLSSGNTGNIFGSTSPLWQQFALVFTTGNQTSVVLIMKNNGVGGCGNDLAIDDIAFKSCGDLTTVSNPSYPTNNFVTCDTSASVTLNASTSGSALYFYQWQSSTDNSNWTNIAGQNSPTFTTPGVSTTTFFRTKIAQDIVNINSPFCSTASNVFTVTILPNLSPAVSNGNTVICSNQSIPALSVTTTTGNVVSWYDQATGGTLLLAGSNTYTPTGPGTYYAEVSNPVTGCFGSSRTPVSLTVTPQPTATFTGSLNYCSGSTTALNLFSDLAGTTFSWTATATNVTGASAGSGNVINQNLTANSSSGSVTYVVTPTFNGCPGTPISITVNVVPLPTVTFASPPTTICSNQTTVLLFSGTPNALITFTNGTNNFTTTLNGTGTGTFTTPVLSTNTTYNLVSASVNNPVVCSQNVSGSVTISIDPNTAITSQPTGGTFCTNATITLSVGATGVNLIYQWFFNGNPIIAATGATYTIASASTTDAGAYTVSVTGNCGTVTSSSATLLITNPTSITTQPQALSPVCAGQSLNLSVAAVGSNLTYQWFKNTTLLSGQTNATLNIPSVTATDAGTYTVVITNTCEVVTSSNAVVVVNDLPVIGTQPQGTTLCAGQNLNLSVAATGTLLTYQWFKNGLAISGATTATYAIAGVTVLDAGNYFVTVNGACSTPLTSSVAAIVINQSPTFTQQPVNTTVCSGQPISLSVATSGGTGVTYQWFKGNTPIPGAIASVFNIASSGITDSGNYTCQVTSVSCAVLLSNVAIVVVNQGPTIVSQSDDLKICVEETATFSVTATGTNLTYQWFKGASAIMGATSNTYSIPNVILSDTGDYYCEISSASCPTTTSNIVSLLVKQLPFATLSLGMSAFICEGESTQVVFNGSGNAIVKYTVNGGSEQTITLNPAGPTILNTDVLTEDTVYELVSVIFDEVNGCSQDLNDSVTVIVNPVPEVTLRDGKICVDPITLTTTRTYLLNTGLNQAEFTFEWFDGNGLIPSATNSFYEVNAIGQYSVTITDIVTGCQASAFANVGQSAAATDFTFEVSGFFADNPTILITPAPAGVYEYQLDFGPFQDSNEFESVAAGIHTLTVRDAEGCGVLTKEVLIVDYPRFFTPNGDGINETWNITSIGSVSVSKISIFDQFGRFIKQMNATESGWDGTYNGQNLPATDYWFTITYQEGGITKEFRSHFSLKR